MYKAVDDHSNIFVVKLPSVRIPKTKRANSLWSDEQSAWNTMYPNLRADVLTLDNQRLLMPFVDPMDLTSLSHDEERAIAKEIHRWIWTNNRKHADLRARHIGRFKHASGKQTVVLIDLKHIQEIPERKNKHTALKEMLKFLKRVLRPR